MPATAAEREQAQALLAVLAQIGAESALARLDRETGRAAYLVRLSDVAHEELVLASAEALASELVADAVEVAREGTAGLLRITVTDQAGKGGPAKQTAIWLPLEVRNAVNAERAKTEESWTAYFLGAFNRQYENLPQMFQQRQTTPGPMPTKRVRKRRGLATPVQMWLYMDEAQRQVLDETVELYGAGSRSALATKIIEADLGLVHAPENP